ncbi:MAG: DUF4375 domain-containing protein [Planctomycetota bacterium]
MTIENNRNVIPWIVVGCFALAFLSYNTRKPSPMLGEEFQLIQKIGISEDESERKQLIDQLASVPERIYPFYSRWLIINDVQPFDCWTDDRYDSSLSDFPRDIQILAATKYGKSDIDNGGFHQFFSNGTGAFAPEMLEWFERSELTDAAEVLRKAMAVFGDDFPRSQAARNEVLSKFQGHSREQRDPFYKMDDEFYASLPYERKTFEKAANRWLREVCGVTSLYQLAENRTRE